MAQRNVALITGITGQDGSYLTELLLDKGYEVHGVVRRSSTENFWRLTQYVQEHVHLHYGDLTDQGSLNRIVAEVKPTEVYNLAAQSFVKESWNQPVTTADITAIGVLRMLEALRECCQEARFYQASSSEMFGKVVESPQTETTPFYPRSPYGVAKVYGHWITVNYRESYGMFAVSGILFNHESRRRGLEFVTRKITDAVARIKVQGSDNVGFLHLGNLDAMRDWGHARDYVTAMFLMLQQPEPRDYVIATGKVHSVRDVCEVAFNHVGMDWEEYVVSGTADHHRPAEVDYLCGDASKARRELRWEPTCTFEGMIREMVNADIARGGGQA